MRRPVGTFVTLILEELTTEVTFFYWARGHAYADNANDLRAIENYTQAILLLNAGGSTQFTYGTQTVSLVELYEARSRNYEKTDNHENAISDLREVVRRSQDAEERRVANEKIQQLSTKRNIP